MKILIIFLMGSITEFHYANKNIVGTYGAYADASWYTELKIKEDSTFQYYDRVELGSSVSQNGFWKCDGTRITLIFDYENQIRPIPEIWKIKGNKIISRRVQRYGKKRRIVLKYQNENG